MGRHEVTHDRRVRIAGEVSDTEGCSVIIGVDYDTVSLTVRGSGVRLTAARAEEFAQIFVSACWAAARQQESMMADAAEILPHDDGTSYCTSIPGKCPVHDA